MFTAGKKTRKIAYSMLIGGLALTLTSCGDEEEAEELQDSMKGTWFQGAVDPGCIELTGSSHRVERAITVSESKKTFTETDIFFTGAGCVEANKFISTASSGSFTLVDGSLAEMPAGSETVNTFKMTYGNEEFKISIHTDAAITKANGTVTADGAFQAGGFCSTNAEGNVVPLTWVKDAEQTVTSLTCQVSGTGIATKKETDLKSLVAVSTDGKKMYFGNTADLDEEGYPKALNTETAGIWNKKAE